MTMPPLPWLLQRADAHYQGEELAEVVHAYARAYAAQRVAPLVEALMIASRYRVAMTLADGTYIGKALAAERENE